MNELKADKSSLIIKVDNSNLTVVMDKTDWIEQN